MRRLNCHRRDRGAAALIVTVLVSGMVLFGVAALTVDVGQWMAEKRVLQNGSDSTALALAKTCANSLAMCSWTKAGADLTNLNNLNAGPDAVSAFNKTVYADGVCQNGLVDPSVMPVCDDTKPTTCLPKPSWMTSTTKFVETHTLTKTNAGGSQLPPIFGRAVGQTGGGKTLAACSRVALMPVSGGTVLPLTFSLCEWNNFVPNANKIVPAPPYTSWPSDPTTYGAFPTYEHMIFLHDTSGSAHCNVGPSGYDLPGGFGWLRPTSGCLVTISDGNWVSTSTGNAPPPSCSLSGLIGKQVLLPVYDHTNGLPGNNLQYQVDFFAAFYITGYRYPSDPNPSTATGNICANSQTCFIGWFTSGLIPAANVDYSGTSANTGVMTPVVAG